MKLTDKILLTAWLIMVFFITAVITTKVLFFNNANAANIKYEHNCMQSSYYRKTTVSFGHNIEKLKNLRHNLCNCIVEKLTDKYGIETVISQINYKSKKELQPIYDTCLIKYTTKGKNNECDNDNDYAFFSNTIGLRCLG